MYEESGRQTGFATPCRADEEQILVFVHESHFNFMFILGFDQLTEKLVIGWPVAGCFFMSWFQFSTSS